ncbi:MAG: hypothetical protein RH862_10110 [Leptospiraceae bacterium]
MKRRVLAIILTGLVAPGCLALDDSFSDGPLLISALSNPTYFFFSDQSASTESRAIVKRDFAGGLRLLSWSGGPGNIWKGAVVNGVIFALENNNQDDVWISRDDAVTWELFDAPSNNESENITNVIGCGTAVIITQSNVAYNGTSPRPGYISYDSGLSWQEFRLGATPASPSGSGDYNVSAIDCNSEKIFVASNNVTNVFQWASLADLNNWTVATSHPASQNGYPSIATSGNSLIGLACTTPGYCPYNPDVNYSLNNGEGMALAGAMPHMGLEFTGVVEYGAGSFYVSELDQTNDICRIYNLGNGAMSPSSSPVGAISCADIGNPQRMPALLVSSSGIFASYSSFSGTETGAVFSGDGGNTLTKIDLNSVFSGDGIVTSIDDAQ